MIQLPIIRDEYELAKKEAENLGHLNRSILKGKGNLAGILGELAVLRYFRYLGAVRENTYNWDLSVSGFKLDVKTKQRTVDPQPHFVGTVPDYSNQDCQAYVFTSVRFNNDLPVSITLCGWMGKEAFKREASFYKKGDVSPENGWVCSMDCWVLEYKKMKPIQSLDCGLLMHSQLN